MYRPLGPRILIKPLAKEERSTGGIILDTGTMDKENLELAEVIELGPLAYADDENGPWVNQKDLILFQRYAGKKIEYKGTVYRILADHDVIAKLDEKRE